MAKDFYEVLGASKNWTTQQIRDRFLELARAKHPDRFQGDEKEQAELEFQSITEAFNVLSDPRRRREIDFELARPKGDAGQAVRTALDVYIERGEHALEAGKMREAIDNLRNAVKEDEKSGRAWYSLAEAYARVPRWAAQAPAAAARAAQLEPMNDRFLFLAGRLFGESGALDRAKTYLKEAANWGADADAVSQLLEELDKKSKGGLFGRIGG